MFGSDTIKLDRMDGINFTRWKERMKFLLTAFKVYYVPEEQQIGILTEKEQRKHNQDEILCRGYILSTLIDRLYDLYTLMNFAREIWNYLQDKYTAEKEGADKFITFKFFEFTMEDNVSILDQKLHMASVTTTDDWWYDSGATTHVCNNKDLFKTYKETEDGNEVMMGDNHTSMVVGSGNVEIQFTSIKKLTLMNVLHDPNIRKNPVFGFKLGKSVVKAMIESDKVILSKASLFVGKAYACDGMFKLNFIECFTFNLWHHRLGHINYRTMTNMLKQGIIFYNGEHKDKHEIFVQAKMKRKDFPKADRQSEILELLHSDICELNGQLTRGDNENNVINIIPVLLNVDDAPKTYKEAITSRNSAF
ncbi:zinc finger, CCHC-type containing protein [Tanacetum coccineum]